MGVGGYDFKRKRIQTIIKLLRYFFAFILQPDMIQIRKCKNRGRRFSQDFSLAMTKKVMTACNFLNNPETSIISSVSRESRMEMFVVNATQISGESERRKRQAREMKR